MTYWQAVCRYAWAETVSILHLNSLIGLTLWIAGTAVILAALYFWGPVDAAKDELLTRLLLLFVTVGAIPSVFAWQLVGTPPRMHHENRRWIKELADAIIETRNGDAAVAGITDRYQAGLKTFRLTPDNWLALMKLWEADFDSVIAHPRFQGRSLVGTTGVFDK